MLLYFSIKNYKSFLDEAVFSMTPAAKQGGLPYSVLNEKCGKEHLRALCSSVIYGPNASGKTNIIGALETFKQLILRGNLKNAEQSSSPNVAAYKLELIPNCNSDSALPVQFEIEFTQRGYKINYILVADLGKFLDMSAERKVVYEKLCVNGSDIFIRDAEKISVFETKATAQFFISKADEIRQAESSLSKDELFLVNGFRLIYAPALAKLVIDWFIGRCAVCCQANAMSTCKISNDSLLAPADECINEAAKLFGLNSIGLGYYRQDENSAPQLCSMFQKTQESGLLLPAEVFESYGTTRLVAIFPLIISALQTGAVLAIDEFGASLHPMAIMSIINAFHNDNINKNHAQLIFNTHNPIFLNSHLFRRDEIKFVEKDDVTKTSNLYSLSDFGTSGTAGVRKGENYMKNYFINRYGAIKDIDFAPLFEKVMQDAGTIKDAEKRKFDTCETKKLYSAVDKADFFMSNTYKFFVAFCGVLCYNYLYQPVRRCCT